MPSSDDLAPEQLRAISATAATFRDWCEAARKRGLALKWPRDDPLLSKLDQAWERASWLAVHAATRATEKESRP
jgi:hypothetical protein